MEKKSRIVKVSQQTYSILNYFFGQIPHVCVIKSGVLRHSAILGQCFVRNSGTFLPCVIFVELSFSWLGLKHIKNSSTINQMTS